MSSVLSSRRPRRRTSSVGRPTSTTRHRTSICSRSPKRCASSTGRSSRPVFFCRSTIRRLRPTIRATPKRRSTSLSHAAEHALRGIPPEKIRYHTCYGINMGPRTSDLEMSHLAKLMLEINAGAYSFEAANPRHEHEWKLWKDVKLPEGKRLIPGVVTHTSVLVEHPELVADRIVRFAEVVGRENVIAGADCGFATHPSATPEIHPTIAWAKLRSLVEGARLASERLWKKAG